jgi:demethylmenaquinone methyltransferase / 2-methoxy-6-polyprenyl-1,4-benzoquinol methylase
MRSVGERPCNSNRVVIILPGVKSVRQSELEEVEDYLARLVMSNMYYESGDKRGARVNELFTRIALRYDLINDVQSLGLHRRWKRQVIDLAGVRPGSRALDICCGTGDLTLALAGRGSETVGLDFNELMLEAAGAKGSAEEGWRRREPGGGTGQVQAKAISAETRRGHAESVRAGFVRGDAQALPFRDETFDIVTVGYGLRNLARWETGLSEMRRVAKPGGRLLVLDFGKPENRVWRSLYFGYLRLFVPCLGRVFCGSASAYAYILESLKNYPAQQGVAAKMEELGLSRVRVIALLGGVMAINYGEKP